MTYTWGGSMQAKENKYVGIWIRVSTEDQAKGDSPEHHEQRARQYADFKGWHIREVYHLEAVSGKALMSQPETRRMLTDIKQGHISGLIFSKLARLGRNTKELLEFADIFREHKADLISLQEAIDTSTPAGRMFYTVIAAMAQWEREEIAERVAASVPIRAKLGKSTGGQAPFGYQWKDKKLVPDPQEAPIRKLMFELFCEHKRKKTVARMLNEAGYRTRSGAKFSDNSIDRLLKDPIAKGVRRANYTRSLGHKKHWAYKPESDWVFSEVESIVSEELWIECNRILATMSSDKKPARKAVQLFAGVTFCHCGSKMYRHTNIGKYICRTCQNKIPAEALEAVFHEQLKAFVFSPEDIAKYLNSAVQTIQGKEELLQTLEREKKKVQTEMDAMMNLYLAGEIKKEGFGKRYGPLEDRIEQIDKQLPALQGEIDFLRIQQLSSDQAIEEAKDFYSHWQELEEVEKRQVVESITDSIIVGTDAVEINLCYLPTSPEFATTWRHNLTGSSRLPA